MSFPIRRAALQCGSVGRCFKFVTILACALPTAQVYADAREVLSLADAVALVAEDQPQLAALASQQQAAIEAAQFERQLPDPKLAFGVENLPATGTDAFRLGREDMTMLTIGVMQDVVPRSKREAASARMTAEAARLSAERALNSRTIQRDVALAWVDAFEAQRRATSLRRLLTELSAEREVSAAQLSSGTTRTADVLAVDMELSSTRDQLILAERDEARARAALSRWIGESALRPLPDALPHTLGAEINFETVVQELDLHPVLQASSHAVDAALREVDRARAERSPDWSWQLMYGQRQYDRSDMVSLQFTVGLPLHRGNRQDKRIAEKLAEASAMRSDFADRSRLLAAELASVRADLNASAKRLAEHEQQRASNARARLETSQAAYAGGSGALVTVWQARRAVVDVDLHHEMILADRARALARLAWLTGRTEVLP